MKKILLVALVLLVSISLFAALNFETADKLFNHGDLDECQTELNKLMSEANSDSEKAQVLWRQSRLDLNFGDKLDEDDKEGRFAFYEKGESEGKESYSLSKNSDALVWVASNIGRWGQTKGILDSLKKAKPMKEVLTEATDSCDCLDSSELWYAMGVLYNSLPGGFISFGDSVVAVSYVRLAVETITDQVWYGGTYKALAEYLEDRDWSQSKRISEIKKIEKKWKKETKSNMEKYKYYEGHAGISYVPMYTNKALSEMTDKEEAIEVLNYAIKMYNERPFLTESDNENYAEIQVLLKEIKG